MTDPVVLDLEFPFQGVSYGFTFTAPDRVRVYFDLEPKGFARWARRKLEDEGNLVPREILPLVSSKLRSLVAARHFKRSLKQRQQPETTKIPPPPIDWRHRAAITLNGITYTMYLVAENALILYCDRYYCGRARWHPILKIVEGYTGDKIPTNAWLSLRAKMALYRPEPVLLR